MDSSTPQMHAALPGQNEEVPNAEAVLAEATRLFRTVVDTVESRLYQDVRPAGEAAPATYLMADDAGREVRVRLDAVPLSQPLAGQSFVNTASDSHVIQLSDRLHPSSVGTVLAGEVRNMSLVRNHAAVGDRPVRGDLLRAVATNPGYHTRLSDRDKANLGKLDWLAAQARTAGPDAAQARADFSAMLDGLGLRNEAPTGSESGTADASLIRSRLAAAHLGEDANALLRELARPADELSQVDADALRAHRSAAAEHAADNAATVRIPTTPGSNADGTGIPKADLRWLAHEAETRRDEVSGATLAALRSEAAALPEGEYPKRKLMLGGGAALAGRDPDVLLVDARGRWHVDPIGEIVQSADQVRGIYDTGMGDPHAVAAPRDRVPLEAVRLWEDELATRGPVVDAYCRLLPGEDGKLLAELAPLDGSEPLRLEVEGPPLMATGVPPEGIPGCAREAPTLPDVVRVVSAHLDGLDSPEARHAKEALDARPDRTGGAAGVRAALADPAVAAELSGTADPRVQGALKTLDATERWEQARDSAPGNVLFGDDVRNGTYDPRASDTWLVAGLGGTGMATAEVILNGNENAKVHLVGGKVAAVVESNPQHLVMRAKHDASMGGDGRLELHTGHRLGAIDMVRGPDGRASFHGPGMAADGYVACMGRVPRLPGAAEALWDWAQERGGTVRGGLMFDRDRQYLGYRVQFEAEGTRHRIEVTGAASRMLPAEVFDQATRNLVNRVSDREIPAESGNVAAGFMATAAQSVRLSEARHTGITGSPDGLSGGKAAGSGRTGTATAAGAGTTAAAGQAAGKTAGARRQASGPGTER